MTAQLEHTNYTVADPDATAAWMCDLFGWHIRWQGPSKDGGTSVHVGTERQYLALYKPAGTPAMPTEDNYKTVRGLNHIAITTDDLEAMERKVVGHGFEAHSHADYEPGKRFYFHDENGIEYEVVSYG